MCATKSGLEVGCGCFPDSGQSSGPGDRVECGCRARGRGYGRPQHRLPELAGSQSAGISPRPPHSSLIWRRSVLVRLRGQANLRLLDQPAVGADDDRGGPRSPADRAFAGVAEFRVGAAAALRPLPAWKAAADFLFAQVSFSVDVLMRWRDANPVEIPVYAGVMVLASEAHAQRMASVIPDIDIPAGLCERVRADRLAGVEAACDQVIQLRDSGAFDGVHLVPVGRYREVAARLEQLLR